MGTPIIHSSRTRTLLMLLAWCTGIMIARNTEFVDPTIWFSVSGLLLAGLVILQARRWTGALLLLALASLSAGWTTVQTAPDSESLDTLVASYTSESMIPIECRGLIISRVSTVHTHQTPADSPRWSTTRRTFDISVRQLKANGNWIDTKGKLRVVLPEKTALDLQAGQLATITGPYRPPSGPRNPGDPDWAAMAAQNGLVGSLYIKHDDLLTTSRPITLLDRICGPFWNLRSGLQSRAIRSLGLEESAAVNNPLMGALILGYRDPGFNEIYQSFQRIGIAHMLAISGFHVAVMLAIAVLFVRLLGEHPLLELLVVLFIIGAILVLLPLRPPILRAIILVVVLLGAGGFGRRYDRVSILLLVATGLLIHRPLDLFSLGYQLSIGITALLLVLPTKEQPEFSRPKRRGIHWSLARSTWLATRANTSCWLVATPAIMLHTGVLSILAPIATLIMLPAIVVMMIAGYTRLGLGMLWPALSDTLAPSTRALSDWATSFTLWIDELPGSSVHAPNLGVPWTIAATLCLVAIVLRRSWRKKPGMWITSLVILSWGAGLVLRSSNEHLLRVDMLDVGNGSCLIIQSGKETILFDAGSLDRRVGDTLNRSTHTLGARPVHTAFVSHDNLDHFNALLNTPEQISLRRVYTSKLLIDDPSLAWISIRDRLEDRGVELLAVHAGDKIVLGECVAEILWPPADTEFESAQDNNSSLVIQWSVQTQDGTRSLLTTGDIEEETMAALTELYPDLRADIIEAPHHGSPNPELLRFLEAINPTVVLQSTGRSRLNDPRLTQARERYRWFATADRGAVWATIRQSSGVEAGWSRSE